MCRRRRLRRAARILAPVVYAGKPMPAPAGRTGEGPAIRRRLPTRKLNEFGGDFRRAEMVKAFLSADECRKRFGQ